VGIGGPFALASGNGRAIESWQIMKALEPPDSHLVTAAHGWLELGRPAEAAQELARVNPALMHHPDVLEAQWGIHAAQQEWTACIETALTLLKVAPKNPVGWIHRSYALHEMKRTAEAAELLMPAVSHFPDQWLVRYNLACYACQLGRPDEAWNWLQNAFELGEEKEIRQMALEDPDLAPLRGRIASFRPPL
jgi:predicted Zn-dependent protease